MAITEADIQKLVENFYEQVRQDHWLAPIFAQKIHEDDWPDHLDHIADFWSSIFLKTGRFKGNPMLKHSLLSDLTPEHFERWLSLFQQVAQDNLSAEKADIFYEMAERIGKSLQMGLAFHYEKSGQADNPFKSFMIRPSKV